LPLRSHIRDKFGFVTENTRGLDYKKAVLLSQDNWFYSQEYIISPKGDYIIPKEHSYAIKEQFTEFVSRYCEAVLKRDINIINEYRYSTLQNYHKELNIPNL